VAVEKVLAVHFNVDFSLVVIPSMAILRPGVACNHEDSFDICLRYAVVALFAACGGLALGLQVNQSHLWLMFSMGADADDFSWVPVLPLSRSITSRSPKRY